MSGTLTNCWTCARSNARGTQCVILPREDRNIVIGVNDWLDAAPMLPDFTVPRTATGCPGWAPREGVSAPVPRPAWVPAPTEAGWWLSYNVSGMGIDRWRKTGIVGLLNEWGRTWAAYPPGTMFLRIPDPPPLEAP